MAPKKEDPIAKIQEMIDSSISKHFGERDQREAESKDPWKRLEGMIDRAVSKHFEAFASSLDEAEGEGGEGGDKGGTAGGGKKEPSFFEQLGLV
jgi:hypothetical protein